MGRPGVTEAAGVVLTPLLEAEAENDGFAPPLVAADEDVVLAPPFGAAEEDVVLAPPLAEVDVLFLPLGMPVLLVPFLLAPRTPPYSMC